MKRLLVTLLKLAVIGVVLATVLPLLWRVVPRATILAPMAPQLAAVAALLAIAALLARFRAFAALSLIVCAWNLFVIWPDVSPWRDGAQAASRPVLKLVSLNLWFYNENLDATTDYLLASGADVIGLVEATPRIKDGLARLKAAYPYSVDCIGTLPKCQTMLFSKTPLKDAYAGPIAGRYPLLAIAEIETGGVPIKVGVTHLNPPFVTKVRPPLIATASAAPAPVLADAPVLEQSRQAANLAAFLADQGADLVLVGDFNSAPWSPIQVAFRAATGLDNRGHLLPTWPSSVWPVLRLPIDPVFVRGRLAVTRIHAGPNVGSDHLPIEAEIAAMPQ